MSKRAVINTAQEAKENPLGVIFDAMIMGGSEAILHQEASGQRSLVESDTLPSDMDCYGHNAKAVLEAAGVKFLGPVEGDEMFQYAELPQGWRKVATDHPMWSNLVDDKGRKRGSIFYKAAYYDRSASMSLVCRFGISFDYDRFDKEKVGVCNVMDGGKVIHTTEPIHVADGEKRYEVSDKANKLALEWLEKNYPDWQNPAAYWD